MLTVVVGEPFEVALAAAPTTGYLWELDPLPAGLRSLDRGFREAPDAAVGDGGTQVLRLQADRPGAYELRVRLKRRWETSALDERTIEVLAREPGAGAGGAAPA